MFLHGRVGFILGEEGLLERLTERVLATPPGVVGIELPEGGEEPPIAGLEETDDGSLDGGDCEHLSIVRGEERPDLVVLVIKDLGSVSKHTRDNLVAIKNNTTALLDIKRSRIITLGIRPELKTSLDIRIKHTNISIITNHIRVNRLINRHFLLI